MANEFKHKDPGSELTQAEFIASDGTGHIFASQATGDILYASSTTALTRLGVASNGNVLELSSGAPAWTASPTIGSTSWDNANHTHAATNSGGTVSANDVSGTTLKSSVVSSSLESVGTLTALTVDDVAVNGKVITMTGSSGDTAVFTVGTDGTLSLVTTDAAASAADLTLDADGQINIDANDAAGIFLGINGTNQINLVDGVLKPVTDNDIDLGVSGGPEFKDGYFNGTLEADAVTIGGTNVVSGSLITTLGTVSAGTWQGTVVAAAYLPDASSSAQGVAELATTAETNTGSDTGRTVTPDGLAGSVHGEKVIQMVVVDFATALTTGNGKFYFHVPSTLNGFNIVDVHAEVISAPAGSTIIIDLYNVTQSGDILSTNLTIDASETGSDTAAAAAAIDTGQDDLATNDVIRVDIDQVGSSTAGSGLLVTLICRLP